MQSSAGTITVAPDVRLDKLERLVDEAERVADRIAELASDPEVVADAARFDSGPYPPEPDLIATLLLQFAAITRNIHKLVRGRP